MSKDWTGYPFGGYDGSDESFEKLQDQGGEVKEIPTVSCRACQGEIHLLGGAQFGEVPDNTPWVDAGESEFCLGTHNPHTPQWSRDQMQRDFEVKGFSMLICVVTRRADGKLGSLDFDHAPRFYYGWQEHTS